MDTRIHLLVALLENLNMMKEAELESSYPVGLLIH
jgi:hypothetical protein